MNTKLCIYCEHYYFSAGERDWSEDTPGYSAEEGCRERYWETNMFEDTEETRRKNLEKAITCPKYEFFKGEPQ